MSTPTIVERKTWGQWFSENTYVRSAQDSLTYRTAQVWEKTPQCIKNGVTTWQSLSTPTRLCLKTAAICSLPGGPAVQLMLGAAAIGSEHTEDARRVLGGTPVSIAGHRVAVKDFLAPQATITTEEILTQIRESLQEPQTLSASAPTVQLTSEELIEQTDQNLKKLIRSASVFSTLYALHSYACGIQEVNEYNKIVTLTQRANSSETSRSPSIWKIFYNTYKDRLSYSQKIKAALFYFCFYYIPIIPNVIDAYMQTFLSVLREKLKEDTKARSDFIQSIVTNNTNFLGVINAATKLFAQEQPTKNSEGILLPGLKLEVYHENVAKDCVTTPDQELFTQFLNAFIKKYPTLVHFKFKFVEGGLNWIISNILKRWIIPILAMKLVKISSEQTKTNGTEDVKTRPYMPVLLVLTTQLNIQMKNLYEKLIKEQNSEHPSNLTVLPSMHIKGLAEFIDNLIETIDLSGPAKIPGAPIESNSLKNIQKRLAIKKDPLDIQITQAISQGLLTSVQYAIQHLSSAENTENLFAKLLESLEGSISGELKTKEQSDQSSYEKARQDLKNITGKIFKKIIDSSVEKEVGSTPEERIEMMAKEFFTSHKQIAVSTFEDLEAIFSSIMEKVDGDDVQDWNETTHITEEITLIKDIITDCTNKESLETRIKTLPPSEQASITNILDPLYLEIKTLGIQVQKLEKQEIQYSHTSQNEVNLKEMQAYLTDIIDLLNPIDIQAIKGKITQIKNISVKLPQENLRFTIEINQHIEKISEKINAIKSLQDRLSNIETLRILSENLIEKTKGWFERIWPTRNIPQEILKAIDLITDDEEERDLLRTTFTNILSWDRNEEFPEESAGLLQTQLDEIQESTEKQLTHTVSHLISKTIFRFTDCIEETKRPIQELKNAQWETRRNTARKLRKTKTELTQKIQAAEKEPLIHLRDKDYKTSLGSLGSIVGTGLALFFPSFAPAINGALATSLYNTSDLANKNPKILAKAALGAAAAMTVSSIATSILPTIAVPVINLAAQGILMEKAASPSIERGTTQVKEKALARVTELFDKGYDNVLTSPLFIHTNRRMLMRDFIRESST